MIESTKIRALSRRVNPQLESSKQSQQKTLIRIFGWTIKIAVSLGALGYIAYKVDAAQMAYHITWIELIDAFSWWNWMFILFASVSVAAINWSIEVLKWHILINTQYEVRWTTSVKGILTGITFGVFSPNRLGEFVGRVLALQPRQRIKASLLSFVNGLAQTLATFTFGVFGMVYLLEKFGYEVLGRYATSVIQVFLVLSLLLIIVLYNRLDLLTRFLQGIKWLRKYRAYTAVFHALSNDLLMKIYHLSLLRFVSFLVQYFIVFAIIFDHPNWVEIAGASILSLFSTTLIPFLPIPDILLRESVALNYFDLFHFNLVKVSLAVFIVWAINVALPAVVGAVVLLTYRIFRTR